jgi:hypothetical protein
MRALIFAILCAGVVVPASAQAPLKATLEATYKAWANSMVRRDAALWQQVTASHRRMEVRNRLVSERRVFPAAIFEVPAPPPALDGLKFLEATQKGPTAKASYFGRVDFGVGGEPTENLLVLSFVNEAGRWLYDRADFVNLEALPEVRAELREGKLNYLKETPEAQPSGVIPPTPIAAPAAKYIAKVYVFCPGREVKVQVNKISSHRFANAKEAEIVIGGAKDGLNEVQFAIRPLEGGTGKEAMTVRVYLLSQVAGVQPIKAFEYQIPEGGTFKPFGTENFVVDAAVATKLAGR